MTATLEREDTSTSAETAADGTPADGTTYALLVERVAASAGEPAVRSWEGGRWVTRTWAEYAALVRSAASALQRMGLRRGDVIAVWADTCLPWAVLDLAAQSFGVVVAGVHPGHPPADVAYELHACGARAIFWGGERPGEHLPEALRAAGPAALPLGAHRLDAFFAEAAARGGHAPDAVAGAELVRPDDDAALLFTSGTSGVPRGVRLTHRNLVAAARSCHAHLGYPRRRPRGLHWLPFAHVMGRMGIYIALVADGFGAFSRGLPHLRDDLRDSGPEVLFAVPKALERFRSAVFARLAEQPAWKRRLFHAALRASNPRTVSLLRRTVFAPVLRQMGGRLELFVVGGAPPDRDVAGFFERLGVAVREGYGLTETTGACLLVPYGAAGDGAHALTPVGDTEFRIAEDGELLLRGASLCAGYLDGDDSAFTPEGWFRTGDLAETDVAGAGIRIRGRKKALLVTNGGENVSPERVEAALAAHPLVVDAFVVGDGRPHLAALLVLDDTVKGGRRVEAALNAVREVNRGLASFEAVRAVAVLDRELTVEAGELTPTLKKRRHVIVERYADEIEALYGPEAALLR